MSLLSKILLHFNKFLFLFLSLRKNTLPLIFSPAFGLPFMSFPFLLWQTSKFKKSFSTQNLNLNFFSLKVKVKEKIVNIINFRVVVVVCDRHSGRRRALKSKKVVIFLFLSKLSPKSAKKT
jgi:hypothetical protein